MSPHATPSESNRLSDRDREILEHVGRYHVSTNEVLHQTLFAGQQPNAVTKVTSRLVRLDWLRKFPLIPPRHYFLLGPRGADRLGLPENRTLPLGPQSLPTEYGVLAFALLGRSGHDRLTPQEIGARWPGIPPGLSSQPYCLDPFDETLELVRVDLGGSPDHVARKCARDIEARRPVEPFAALLADRRFRLVVVSGTAEKGAAVREALDRHVWPTGLLIHLAIVPDLLHLTARCE